VRKRRGKQSKRLQSCDWVVAKDSKEGKRSVVEGHKKKKGKPPAMEKGGSQSKKRRVKQAVISKG